MYVYVYIERDIHRDMTSFILFRFDTDIITKLIAYQYVQHGMIVQL